MARNENYEGIRQRSRDPAPNRMVIGVDFGTTFSGVSSMWESRCYEPTWESVEAKKEQEDIPEKALAHQYTRDKAPQTPPHLSFAVGQVIDVKLSPPKCDEPMPYGRARRFVVVVQSGRQFIAVPISTYGGKGIVQRSMKREHHVIVSSQRRPPSEPLSEDEMLRRPIRVDSSTSYTKKLDPMARLDYCESFEYSYAEGTYGPSAIGGVHRNTPFALRMRQYSNHHRMSGALGRSMRRFILSSWSTLAWLTTGCMPLTMAESLRPDDLSIHGPDIQHVERVINPLISGRAGDNPWLINFNNVGDSDGMGLGPVPLLTALAFELLVVYKLRPYDRYKSRAVGVCLVGVLIVCAVCAATLTQLVAFEWLGLNVAILVSAIVHEWFAEAPSAADVDTAEKVQSTQW